MIWLYLIVCPPNFEGCVTYEPIGFESEELCRSAQVEVMNSDEVKAIATADYPLLSVSYCLDRKSAYEWGLPLPVGRGI